jgi:regulatory protein
VSSPHRPSEPLLNAALGLLAVRIRGTEELRGRLLKKGFESREVSRCLRWLEERELLDDRAFARAFLRDRLRFSPRSPALLRQELTLKGIPRRMAEETTVEVFQEEEISEEELSRKAARRWVRKQSPATLDRLLGERFSPERERERRRLYGFLSRRGFRGDAARAGMEEGEEEARAIRG